MGTDAFFVVYPPFVGCSVTLALRSADIRAFRTKKGSSLIHRWRGGCLVIVYLESRYVVLGCFVLPMGVSLTYISYSGDRQHSHYRHRRIYATTAISHFRTYVFDFTFTLGQISFYFPLLCKPLFCHVCRLRLSG